MKKIFLGFLIVGMAFLGISRVSAQTFEELQKIVATNGEGNDFFGASSASISISGNRAIIGAAGDDDGELNSGAAYIYDWNGSTWVESVKLTASDGQSDDQYGYAVAIDGDTAIVGAYGDDDKGSNSGSVYIYKWNGSSWAETKLTASDEVGTDFFGWNVAISGDTFVVGSMGDDDKGSFSGSTYVYKWNGSSWAETKITASDGAASDRFGYSVSISGNTIVAGSVYDDDNGDSSGSAYVYIWNGSSWVETKLTASDGNAGDDFGFAVAVDGNSIIVGAEDNGVAGAAYLFKWNGSTWIETKLIATSITTGGKFGHSVAISGDKAIAGTALGAYAAYLFEWNGSAWVETKLVGSDSDGSFGMSVSISGDNILVGNYSTAAAYAFGIASYPDNFCSDAATLTSPYPGLIYWDLDGNNPYLANTGGTATVLIIAPAETVLTSAEITTLDGSAEPGMVYFDEETGELYISDASGALQDPSTITSNAVADTAAVEASAVAGEVYFNTTTGEVYYCEVDGTLDNPADPSSSCLTQ